MAVVLDAVQYPFKRFLGSRFPMLIAELLGHSVQTKQLPEAPAIGNLQRSKVSKVPVESAVSVTGMANPHGCVW